MDKASRQRERDLSEDIHRKHIDNIREGAKQNRYYASRSNNYSGGESISSRIVRAFVRMFAIGFFIIFGLFIISLIYPSVGIFIQNATDPLWYYIADLIAESRK